MTKTIDLPADLATRLQNFAVTQGKAPELILRELIEELPAVEDGSGAKRVAGLHRGVVTYMSADFDASLPHGFWSDSRTPPAG